MKTLSQRKKESEFENELHISRKKKAIARQTNEKNIKAKHIAYNLDDPDDMRAYERYLK